MNPSSFDVRLVSLLIHHAAAVRTEQYAGEQTHFIIAVGAFALFAKLLHPFPCLGVYDRLVVVLENHLLFRGIFYTVLDFVRKFFCFHLPSGVDVSDYEIYEVATSDGVKRLRYPRLDLSM